jgi:hypothetical protein
MSFRVRYANPGLPELTSIGGGADEVMLIVLCKMMGTLPATDRM